MSNSKIILTAVLFLVFAFLATENYCLYWAAPGRVEAVADGQFPACDGITTSASSCSGPSCFVYGESRQ
jgi:hypothetical protein